MYKTDDSNSRGMRQALVVALASASVVGFAQANPGAGKRATVIEEVVVTAQKRKESLQDAPIAITAFSSSHIEDMGISQVSDIGQFTPNLTIHKQSGSNSTVSFSIRGITEPEPSLSVDPAVGIYMDGIYMARNNGLAFDVVDLERIEVLRGPQGTLYGRNSTGGAVNLVTARPTGEFAFKQVLTAGNRDRLKSHTTVDLPAAGGVSAKLSYLHSEQDGYVKNNTTNFQQGKAEDFGAVSSDAFHIALRWDASDVFAVDYSYDQTDMTGTPAAFQLTVADAIPTSVFGPNFDPSLNFGSGSNDLGIADQVLLGTYQAFGNTPTSSLCSTDANCVNFANSNNAAFGGATPAQAQLGTYLGVYGNAVAAADPDRRSSLNVPYAGEENMGVLGHSVIMTWDLSESLTLKSLSGYREMDIKHRTGLSGGGFLETPTGNVITLFAAGAPNKKSQQQLSQEFQLLGSTSRLEYLVGLYYFEEQASEVSREQTPFLFGSFGTARSYDTDNSAWAAFGQLTFTPPVLEERLDITAGLRYTEDERAIEIAEVVQGVVASDNFSEDYSNVSANLTFDYFFNDRSSGYFRVGTGYKSGGFLSRTSIANQRPFDEETLTSYELGLKSQWLNNRLRFNAALFYSVYEDKQVTQFVPTPSGAESTIQNAAETSYQGFEMELFAIPMEGLSVSLNYGYVDPEYDKYTFFDPSGAFCGSPGSSCDVSDRGVFGSTADHTASLALQYDFVPFSWGALSARTDVSYNSGYTYGTVKTRFDEYVRNDAYSLVNARLTLSDVAVSDQGMMRFAIWGKNLTDETYRQGGIAAFESIGFAGAVYNEPTSYGVDITFEY